MAPGAPLLQPWTPGALFAFGILKAVSGKMRATIERLQALRGIATISAVMLVAEPGELPRFAHLRPLPDHSGVVVREHSSGERLRSAASEASIPYLSRIVTEAARGTGVDNYRDARFAKTLTMDMAVKIRLITADYQIE